MGSDHDEGRDRWSNSWEGRDGCSDGEGRRANAVMVGRDRCSGDGSRCSDDGRGTAGAVMVGGGRGRCSGDGEELMQWWW